MDRRPQDDPANADPKHQQEQAARASDSKGQPKPGAEAGRG